MVFRILETVSERQQELKDAVDKNNEEELDGFCEH